MRVAAAAAGGQSAGSGHAACWRWCRTVIVRGCVDVGGCHCCSVWQSGCVDSLNLLHTSESHHTTTRPCICHLHLSPRHLSSITHSSTWHPLPGSAYFTPPVVWLSPFSSVSKMAAGGAHLSKEFFELVKSIGESRSKQEEVSSKTHSLLHYLLLSPLELDPSLPPALPTALFPLTHSCATQCSVRTRTRLVRSPLLVCSPVVPLLSSPPRTRSSWLR